MPQDASSAASSLMNCSDQAAVEQIAKWILTGAREADVREAIAQTWPERDARPLIAAAIAEFSQAGQVSRAAVRGFAFEATKDLYRQMREIGDFAGALRALKQLVDLAA